MISLQQLACNTLLEASFTVEEVLHKLPPGMAPFLLDNAIIQEQSDAAIKIVANWPSSELCLGDLKCRNHIKDGSIYSILFEGLMSQSCNSKLRTIDCCCPSEDKLFDDMDESRGCSQMTQICLWPIYFIPKECRNLDYLMSEINRGNHNGCLERQQVVNVVEWFLKVLASDDKFQRVGTIPHSLAIKVDSVHLNFINFALNVEDKIDCLKALTYQSYIHYAIIARISHITSITLIPNNISVRYYVDIFSDTNDEWQYLYASGIFCDCFVRNLNGQLQLYGFDLHRLISSACHISVFSRLTSLCLKECSVILRSGQTRNRIHDREYVVRLMHNFPSITSLDLGKNYLFGCLSTILEEVNRPLEYLNLSDTNISSGDLEYLATSKHAKTLRHLEMDHVCGLFEGDELAVTHSNLVNFLKFFTNLEVLSLAWNRLDDSSMNELEKSISDVWTKLRIFRVHHNLINPSKVLKLIQVVCRLPCFKQLSLSHYREGSQVGFEDPFNSRALFMNQIDKQLKSAHRTDILVTER